MKRRPKPAVPILSPSFEWHSSASHDAGSAPFLERQRERIRRMQEKPAPNVATIMIRNHKGAA